MLSTALRDVAYKRKGKYLCSDLEALYEGAVNAQPAVAGKILAHGPNIYIGASVVAPYKTPATQAQIN